MSGECDDCGEHTLDCCCNEEDYWNYDTREKMKQMGWEVFSTHFNPEIRARALMMYIIRAHYWRAREALEERKDCNQCLRKIRGKDYYNGYTLDFDHYAQHWLYSNKDADFLKGDVLDNCSEYWYTPKKSEYLVNGASEYQF